MATYRYQNITDQDLTLIGVGMVAAGESVETDVELVNPNFERVSDTKRAKANVSKEDGDGE